MIFTLYEIYYSYNKNTNMEPINKGDVVIKIENKENKENINTCKENMKNRVVITIFVSCILFVLVVILAMKTK